MDSACLGWNPDPSTFCLNDLKQVSQLLYPCLCICKGGNNSTDLIGFWCGLWPLYIKYLEQCLAHIRCSINMSYICRTWNLFPISHFNTYKVGTLLHFLSHYLLKTVIGVLSSQLHRNSLFKVTKNLNDFQSNGYFYVLIFLDFSNIFFPIVNHSLLLETLSLWLLWHHTVLVSFLSWWLQLHGLFCWPW